MTRKNKKDLSKKTTMVVTAVDKVDVVVTITTRDLIKEEPKIGMVNLVATIANHQNQRMIGLPLRNFLRIKEIQQVFAAGGDLSHLPKREVLTTGAEELVEGQAFIQVDLS